MLYAFYQTAADWTLPMRTWAAIGAATTGQGFSLGGEASAERWRAASALCEMMSRAALSHRRPSFGIDEVKVGNQLVPVREEEVLATPFGTGVTSLGIPLGLGLILLAIALTGLYVRQANRHHDAQMAAIIRDHGA